MKELLTKYCKSSIALKGGDNPGGYYLTGDELDELLSELDYAITDFGLTDNQQHANSLGQSLISLYDNIYYQVF